jgi:hypothetical protein
MVPDTLNEFMDSQSVHFWDASDAVPVEPQEQPTDQDGMLLQSLNLNLCAI